MMKLLALAVILSLCALSGGAELIHNPAFYNPKQVSTGQAAGLKKYGIRMKTGVLPFGWTVSCNSLKVVDGLIDSQKIKDRMSLHFSSVWRDHFLQSYENSTGKVWQSGMGALSGHSRQR